MLVNSEEYLCIINFLSYI